MDRNLEIFRRFVPEGAATYCYQLWQEHDFNFKIKRSRKTKLGDYRYDPRKKEHTITINNDLNRYAFLVTYLHEVAHLLTYQTHRNQVAPHGKEWKSAFKQVSLPVLRPEILPHEILSAFSGYLVNPKASSCADPRLLKTLRIYDEGDTDPLLAELKPGTLFRLQGRTFTVVEKKRTRFVCREERSGKRYLISQNAPVEVL